MPVEVSLLSLVSIADTRHLWPAEFDAFVKAIEEKPADKAAWGAAADWCDEHNEPELARGFRFVSHNSRIVVACTDNGMTWYFRWLPKYVGEAATTQPEDISTAAGAAARLAQKLIKAEADLKSALEELK